MKRWLRTQLQRTISALTSWYDQLEQQPEVSTTTKAFSALTPIDTVDNANYDHALRWALDQPKSKLLFNIALTGPYGSGKSSVIRTFERTNRFRGYHFLNISLATFKEDGTALATNGTTEKDKQATVNQIEASILQQLFYKEEDKTIPESRFKKINRPDKPKRYAEVIGISIWLIALTYLFFNKNFTRVFSFLSFPETLTGLGFTKEFLSSCIFIGGIIYFISQVTKLIAKIKLSKIKVFDSEIELDTTINKSILNQHIEEIIYFFEATRYNVVVIEDLDRFNQPEIFTKLREINSLLNSSQKIRRTIKFLYAVRDDMFKDKDRAKFFDFIIPIIPVINYSNSSEILRKYSKDNNYNWHETVIDDIALFIDDMRLLHNITNEYRIYSTSLNSSLDPNKLLALIVYKNMFPNDFVALSEGRGVLQSVFEKKKEIIFKKIEQIESQILELNIEIDRIIDVSLKNEEELNSLYVLKALEPIRGFVSFHHNGEDLTPDTIIKSKFSLLTNNELSVMINTSGYYTPTNRGLSNSFEYFEKQVDPINSYNQRLELVKSKVNNKIKQIKAKIESLISTKKQVNNMLLKELVKEDSMSFLTGEVNQSNLLSVLFRKGYLDESYMNYISIFYEGSLTKNDNEFLIAVKAGRVSTSYIKLTNVSKVVQKLQLNEFAEETCFNPSLLLFLLENSAQYDQQLAIVFRKLADESEGSVQLIKYLLDQRFSPGLLLPKLAEAWSNLWNYFYSRAEYTDEFHDNLFVGIVQYVPVPTIEGLTYRTSLVDYAGDKPDFLEITSDQEKIKQLIQRLNIVFQTILPVFFPDSLIDVVYLGNHYQLNYFMIKLILEKKGKFDQYAFDTRNYTTIQDSALTELVDYIESNINEYVRDVLLSLPENKHETEENILKLIQNDSLSLEYKKAIITQAEVKFTEISELIPNELIPLLLKQNKIAVTWPNLVYTFTSLENSLSDELISFLSKQDNINVLPDLKSDEADTIEGYELFIDTFLSKNEVADNSYDKICYLIPDVYDANELSISSHSRSKLQSLYFSRTIRLNEPNTEALFDLDKNIGMAYLRIYFEEYSKAENSFPLSSKSLLYCIVNDQFSSQQKVDLINNCDPSEVGIDVDAVSTLALFINQLPDNPIVPAVIEMILCTDIIPSDLKIRLFKKYNKRLTEFSLWQLVEQLGEPYENILQEVKLKLPYTEENDWLARQLRLNGFIRSVNFADKGKSLTLHPPKNA